MQRRKEFNLTVLRMKNFVKRGALSSKTLRTYSMLHLYYGHVLCLLEVGQFIKYSTTTFLGIIHPIIVVPSIVIFQNYYFNFIVQNLPTLQHIYPQILHFFCQIVNDKSIFAYILTSNRGYKLLTLNYYTNNCNISLN